MLPYKSKLEDALQVLQRKVEAVRAILRESRQPGSTSPTSSAPHPSAPLSPQLPEPEPSPQNTGCGSPNSSCSDRPTSHCAEIDVFPERDGNRQSGALGPLLVLEGEKRSKEKRDYLSSPDCDPIDGSETFDWTEEDPRVIDLRLGSSPNPSFDVKFRRGLSQRSLAGEYNQWERETFNISRVIELSQKPSNIRRPQWPYRSLFASQYPSIQRSKLNTTWNQTWNQTACFRIHLRICWGVSDFDISVQCVPLGEIQRAFHDEAFS